MVNYLKINNALNGFGQYDYKNLDISKFINGSQIYPKNENFIYCASTQEDIPSHSDILVITEQEYLDYRQVYEAQKQLEQYTIEQRIKDIEDIILMQEGVI